MPWSPAESTLGVSKVELGISGSLSDVSSVHCRTQPLSTSGQSPLRSGDAGQLET